jgi:penicillin-insensitive murein endopeptidase
MLAPKVGLTPEEREKLAAATMLSADREGLDAKKWGDAQKWILQQAVADARVDRIFVNPVIKRELCISESGAAWLHKLRPWWGHDDHWHVRLRCSAQDPACVATDAIPPGSGCDSTLDWWFSEDAQKKGIENNAKSAPRVLPKLPPECAAVLKG